ncbi:hypothetical protein TNCV_2031171 [Trichonephila clavipes]|nr:hypothetical protein TNCV_2031171 [Trichonephila clavipes]
MASAEHPLQMTALLLRKHFEPRRIEANRHPLDVASRWRTVGKTRGGPIIGYLLLRPWHFEKSKRDLLVKTTELSLNLYNATGIQEGTITQRLNVGDLYVKRPLTLSHKKDCLAGCREHLSWTADDTGLFDRGTLDECQSAALLDSDQFPNLGAGCAHFGFTITLSDVWISLRGIMNTLEKKRELIVGLTTAATAIE